MARGIPHPDQVLATMRQYLDTWHERYGVVDIGVFGSVARDEARADSDIDVWVRMDPLTPYGMVHLKQELEILLESSVDLVRMRERMHPGLRACILREGVSA